MAETTVNDRSVKVLLVEDDEDDYLITRDLLAEIGETAIALDWVSKCEDAREAIRREQNDVILLDYRLGERTGLELLREAVAEGCKTPIILLTGQGDHEVDVQAMKAGAADYLIKGKIDAGLLERAIRYAIERAQTLELRQEQLAAEASNRARSEFLAIVSHELRSPLSVVLGFVDILSDMDVLEHQREVLAAIRRSGNHLRALVNDMLDFAKIEAGKLTVCRGDCSPREIMKEVVSMLQPKEGVELAMTDVDDVPDAIHTDPTRLRQILLNLVGNAIKFTSRGGIELGARAVRTCELETPQICFEVRDTGIGLSEKQLAELFEPFSQGKAGSSGGWAGTGLGLTISKRLAQLLGGDITVKSQPGVGSTFTLTIATRLGDAASTGDVHAFFEGDPAVGSLSQAAART
jgi:signal transduction histidine kinase